MMIDRETFDWGVRLVARPFDSGEHASLVMQADIGPYKHNRGSDVRITCTGVPAAAPLRLGDAQIWYEAMYALVNEARALIAQMKAAGQAAKAGKKR